MESEIAASNEAELDVIRSFEIKPYLTEKVKQFQAGCIKILLVKGPATLWARRF